MNSDIKTYGTVFAVLLIPCVLFIVVSSSLTVIFPQSPWAYAMQYNTDSENVLIDGKPHDCAFLKAPIGSKYCHFEKIVVTQKGDEVLHTKTRVLVTWNKVSE